jgi:hypothetical protein
MANYELHEFDPVKVFTGEIDPLEVNSFKHEAYNTNTVGQIVIDKNNPTDTKRKFISLATKKTSYTKFNQIIDIEFAEFIAKSVVDPTLFLQAKINSLEALIENLRSNRNTDKSKIDALIQQIEALQAQLDALKNPASANKIPFYLNYGQQLIAGSEIQITGSLSTGSLSTTQGITGSMSTSPSSSFTIPGDRLLSKNRKYVAIIQGDRNFVIYKGEFDERGYPLENTVVEPFGLGRTSLTGVGYATVQEAAAATLPQEGTFRLTLNDTGLLIYKSTGVTIIDAQGNTRSDPAANGRSRNAVYVFTSKNPDGLGNVPSNAKLILEDSGRIVATGNSQRIWTSES